jgi:uncharacterized protein YacL
VSIELVLRFIGGILAGVVTAEVAPGLFETTDPARGVDTLLASASMVFLAFAIGFAVAPYLTTVPFYWFRERVLHASGPDFLAGGVGLVVGLICGALVHAPLAQIPGTLGDVLPVAASAIFGYFGIITAVHHKHDVLGLLGGIREGLRPAIAPGSERVLVDTSAIIDGRLAGVAQAGFLFCTLVVPRFVLVELQQVADSSDSSRRMRGRRGLDILDQLQKHSLAPVEIADLDADGPLDVDSRLVYLARDHDWPLLTTDYNLNKVATLQGVRVLNLNELANALKPMCIPGDVLRLRIHAEGKDPGQGVGYLPDGTMVVVEGASHLIGQEHDIEVTRLLQTPAGRIIFARRKS